MCVTCGIMCNSIHDDYPHPHQWIDGQNSNLIISNLWKSTYNSDGILRMWHWTDLISRWQV